jgi:hypothetical protein
MAQKLKFGNGTWATKEGSTLAYNDENNNYKPLPFTTTRNSIGTRVNKEGLIEVVGNNIPRIDYKDSADGVLLLENSSTNLYTYSDDFSHSNWSKDYVSVNSSQIISPDGNLNTYEIKENTSNNEHSIRQLKSLTSGNYYTISVFVKKSLNQRDIYIRCGDANILVLFDTTNWEVGDEIQGFGKIENYGNGWYRLIATGLSDSTGSDNFRIGLSDGITNGSQNYTGNGTNSMYFYGAQLEANSFSTSYIPTSGSTVQRAADTASGAGNSEVFNDSEGVLFANIAALANDLTNRTIALSDGTTSNTVRIQYLTISNAIWATVTNIGAGGNQAILQYTSSDITINSKISLKYKANDFSLWVNGFEVATDTSGVTFSANTLNTFQFDRGNGAEDFYGKTKELGYYDEILTDLELETLTSYRSLNELVTVLNLNEL